MFSNPSRTLVHQTPQGWLLESKSAENPHPVLVPADKVAMGGRFEIRTWRQAGHDEKELATEKFVISWTTLETRRANIVETQEVKTPLLIFSDPTMASAALARIEAGVTRKWWRKAVKTYQVVGFTAVVLGVIVVLTGLMHRTAVSQQPMTMSSADTEVDPAVLQAMLKQQGAFAKSQGQSGLANQALAAPGGGGSPATIQEPEAAMPSLPNAGSVEAGSDTPSSPSASVLNALNGKAKKP